MPENPVGTKALREELRQPRDKWRTRIAPYSTTTYLRSALDGLDIAEEMALAQEVAEYCKNRFAPYTRHWRSLAEHRLWELSRRWQDWKQGR